MKEYDHKKIERKWQKEWKEKEIYKTLNNSKKEKYYVLDMFPYPSGEGLHVGHPKGYIATDIISRKKRMQGFNVLHPMGFDAFGLPAENYAIKTKTNPSVAVAKNVARFKKQLEIIGLDYDWSREINTTDPKYYKWTQWIFLQMYKKGLAYESYEPINWCPSCKTGLANEDVENGNCERCGSLIEKKPMRQWVLRITDYAERLLDDLDLLDWPKSIKESQRNWIGKSEGVEIKFKVTATGKFSSGPRTREDEEPDHSENLSSSLSFVKVFTTRADTIYSATYVVLAPEHKLLQKLKEDISNWKEVETYINKVKNKAEIERTAENKEKTGIELKGIKAINPANREEIPIWIADYVLVSYASGAIMAVPAYDDRDKDFAMKYNLPIIEKDLVDKKEITEFIGGKVVTKYKLRDWVFSRQRYWGEPIPLLHDKEKVVPVKEKDLPVILPEVRSYEPTGTGESPLAGIDEWVNVKVNGKILKRETNTMPQWAGSSWYYLRYMDPNNGKELVGKKKEKYWQEVDYYVGGAEHATRHLIYARFWHKFLYDIGVVSTKEPFHKLQSVGLIIGEDGRKMSKRFGNIVNPDEIVHLYGADTLRLYEMFMGPFNQSSTWSTESIIGPRRFLERVWNIAQRVNINKKSKTSKKIEKSLHRTIKKVTEDINIMSFNTAISAMMIFTNDLEINNIEINNKDFKRFLKILAPFTPHITEEIWMEMGERKSIHLGSWPKWDADKILENKVKIVVQVNGKVRTQIFVDISMNKEQVKTKILEDKIVQNWVSNKPIKKIIYIPSKIINFVL